MASFFRPTHLSDALAALAAGPRTMMAGGTDHYPARAIHEPDEDIVDLSALPGLQTITRADRADEGPAWRIPALATWTDVIEAPLPPLFDGLKQAAAQIGGWQIQNAGTVVGNVCNASPAADGIPALLALDSLVELSSLRGVRTLGLADFVLGPRSTARRADEMVTALIVPDRPANSRFLKLGGRRYLVISISMVAVTLQTDPAGCVTHAAVAVGACGPVATRLPALEAALLGRRPDRVRLDPDHLAALTPIDDLRAPAVYRLQATLELLRRAVMPLLAVAA